MRLYLFFVIPVLFCSTVLAELQIFPTRVFLNKRTKVTTISLKHQADKVKSYKISTKYYRMKEDGSLNADTNLVKEDFSAHRMIRFSPRRVDLQPGVEQVIRIMLRGANNKEKGAYRTHLYFEEVDPPAPLATKNSPSSGGGMNLEAKIAIAIPVFVDLEADPPKGEITDFALFKQGQEYLYRFDLKRVGPTYLHGNLRIFHKIGDQKKIIGLVNGLSSYIEKRSVTYRANEFDGKDADKGEFIVEFLTPPELGDKMIATATFPAKKEDDNKAEKDVSTKSEKDGTN